MDNSEQHAQHSAIRRESILTSQFHEPVYLVNSLCCREMQWDSLPFDKARGQIQRGVVSNRDPDAEAGAGEVDFPD